KALTAARVDQEADRERVAAEAEQELGRGKEQAAVQDREQAERIQAGQVRASERGPAEATLRADRAVVRPLLCRWAKRRCRICCACSRSSAKPHTEIIQNSLIRPHGSRNWRRCRRTRR